MFCPIFSIMYTELVKFDSISWSFFITDFLGVIFVVVFFHFQLGFILVPIFLEYLHMFDIGYNLNCNKNYFASFF